MNLNLHFIPALEPSVDWHWQKFWDSSGPTIATVTVPATFQSRLLSSPVSKCETISLAEFLCSNRKCLLPVSPDVPNKNPTFRRIPRNVSRSAGSIVERLIRGSGKRELLPVISGRRNLRSRAIISTFGGRKAVGAWYAGAQSHVSEWKVADTFSRPVSGASIFPVPRSTEIIVRDSFTIVRSTFDAGPGPGPGPRSLSLAADASPVVDFQTKWAEMK